MRFRKNVGLDPSQIEDRRGQGPMLGLPGGGLTVGGGGLGLVGLVIYLLINVVASSGGLSGPLGNLNGSTVSQAPPGQVLGQECRTGAEANTREDCRIVAVREQHPELLDEPLRRPSSARTRPRRQSSSPAPPTPAAGPPAPTSGRSTARPTSSVYIDLGFFDELRTRFGAQGGPFAQAYVLAHEYGHHVQDLLGTLGQASGQTGAQGQSVRTELQADCFAGVWANHATQTGYIVDLTARRTSPTRSTPPRPSATTASSRRRRGGSTARRGRTARRLSGSTGSASATEPARPASATRSPGRSRTTPWNGPPGMGRRGGLRFST